MRSSIFFTFKFALIVAPVAFAYPYFDNDYVYERGLDPADGKALHCSRDPGCSSPKLRSLSSSCLDPLFSTPFSSRIAAQMHSTTVQNPDNSEAHARAPIWRSIKEQLARISILKEALVDQPPEKEEPLNSK
ncbi:hypothetical protein Hypma_003952 [Hypsizygus marmoreus]|uniref:Uncharacterized protein n=1 Tax=Hypsizygus marmoreus TaxID=39966 RepID=A0A369JA00_HYPMA|nr:hypothetical protein Hypma_003952 [Hypsizygus marmoreus]